MDTNKINQLIAEKIMGLREKNVPEYTNSLIRMWEVVAKLKEDFIVEIRIESDSIECRLFKEDPDNDEILFSALAVEADTVPLAICLAALKSRGVEI